MPATAVEAPTAYAPGARLLLSLKIVRPERQDHMTYLIPGRATFVRVFLVAPALKVLRLSLEAKALALFAGLFAFLRQDMYWTLLPALMAASGLDWMEGRNVAKRGKARRSYDPSLSLIGLHAKASALGITALFWYMEWWGAKFGVFNSHGYVAVALVFALIAAELESYNSHRRKLGKRPIPLLTEAIAVLRGAITKRSGIPLPPKDGAA